MLQFVAGWVGWVAGWVGWVAGWVGWVHVFTLWYCVMRMAVYHVSGYGGCGALGGHSLTTRHHAGRSVGSSIQLVCARCPQGVVTTKAEKGSRQFSHRQTHWNRIGEHKGIE